MDQDQKNIWYLAGPMFQYNEDVKALARLAGLKIVDAAVAVDRVNAAEVVPEVTIKAEYAERTMSANGGHIPTTAELLSARADLLATHDQLLERERALDERAQRLTEAEKRVAEHARANEVEAQRLSAELVTIQAERSTAVAAAAAAAVTASASTEKPAKAAKA